MPIRRKGAYFTSIVRVAFAFVFLSVVVGVTNSPILAADVQLAASDIPTPLLGKDRSVDWWFVFKLNTKFFPGCGGSAVRQCLFGGDVQDYKAFGQQYVFASSVDEALQKGSDCAGDTTRDPIGATFDEAYNELLLLRRLERSVL